MFTKWLLAGLMSGLLVVPLLGQDDDLDFIDRLDRGIVLAVSTAVPSARIRAQAGLVERYRDLRQRSGTKRWDYERVGILVSYEVYESAADAEAALVLMSTTTNLGAQRVEGGPGDSTYVVIGTVPGNEIMKFRKGRVVMQLRAPSEGDLDRISRALVSVIEREGGTRPPLGRER